MNFQTITKKNDLNSRLHYLVLVMFGANLVLAAGCRSPSVMIATPNLLNPVSLSPVVSTGARREFSIQTEISARIVASSTYSSTTVSYGGYSSTSTKTSSKRAADLEDKIMVHTAGRREYAICNFEVEVQHVTADIFFGLGMVMTDGLNADMTGTVVTVEESK